MSETTTDSTENEVKACPTQSGTMEGYQVEVRNADDVWKVLVGGDDNHIVKIDNPGKHPILSLSVMLSYEEAMAIAWLHKLANPFSRLLKDVRVVPYKITYDFKAWRKEDEVEIV